MVRYVIALYKEGDRLNTRCGTDHTHIVRSKQQLNRSIEIMSKRPDCMEIRSVSNITQKMCEMDPHEYADYIRKVGTLEWHHS